MFTVCNRGEDNYVQLHLQKFNYGKRHLFSITALHLN